MLNTRRWLERAGAVVLIGMGTVAAVPAGAQAQRGGLPPTPPVQSGGYTLDAQARPRQVKPGETVTIEASVTASQAVQNQRVDVEVLDAANRKVGQQIYSNQSFVPGQTRTYRWQWQAPANLPEGDYTVKVGIFSHDWQQLIAWDNLAATFRVGGAAGPAGLSRTPAVQSGSYTLDAKANPRHIKPGDLVTIETTVTPSQAAQNQRVDVEILDSNNRKVAQQVYSSQQFAPGQARTYRWQWQAPANLPLGNYTVKIGVFSADWQHLAAWDNLAAMFRVGTPAVQSGGYTLDARARPRHVKPGDEVTIETVVTPNQAAQNQRVDVEILDSNNRKVAQQVYEGQQFAPGETRTYHWTWRAPANLTHGVYTVKVGIFRADWQRMIAWDDMAAVFRVGPAGQARANQPGR